MQDKDNIFDIIRDKANSHEDPVPQDAWENISNRKKRRRFGFFWPVMLVLLTGALFIGYHQYFGVEPNTVGKSIASSDLKHQDDGQPAMVPSNNQPNTDYAEKKLVVEYEEDNNTTDNTSGKQLVTPNNQISKHTQTTEKEVAHQSSNTHVKTTHHQVVNATKRNKAVIGVSDGVELVSENDASINNVKRKKNRKDKGKSNMAVTNADQEELFAITRNQQKNPTEIAVDKVTEPELIPVPQHDLPLVAIETGKQTISAPDSSIQNDIINRAVTSKDDKQDKQNKHAKRHIDFDLSLMPVFPITGQGQALSFNRTLIYANGKTAFSGRLTKAVIDPSMAFTASVRKEISKNLTTGVGLQYLRLKEYVTISGSQLTTIYNYSDSHLNANDGTSMISDTIAMYLQKDRDFKSVNTYSMLSVPVFVQYTLLKKGNWQIGMEGGVNVHVINRFRNNVNRNLVAPLDCTVSMVDKQASVNMAYFAGMRFDRRINNSMGVFIYPNLMYNPVKQGLLDRRIHRFGIGVGMSMRLR